MDKEKLIHFLTIKPGLKPHTIKNHSSRIDLFLRWLNGREISKQVMEEFFYELTKKDIKAGTYNAYLATFQWVDRFNKDQCHPTDYMDGYKSKENDSDPIQILSTEQVKKLLSTNITFKFKSEAMRELDDFYLLFTRFLYFTACRAQEGIKLKVKFYDTGTHAIYFTKTKTSRNRRVYLEDPFLIKELDRLVQGKGEDDYIFLTPKNKLICWQVFWDNLKKRCEFAKVRKIHPHTLRHSQASHLYQAGVPLEIVSLILGHANVDITFKTYIHVADGPIKQAFTRSPLVQDLVTPLQRIADIKKTLDALHIEQDTRLRDFYKDLQMVFLKYS